MQSVIQHIEVEVQHVKKLLIDLMEHSDVVRWNYSKIIMSRVGDYQWTKLNDAGLKAQTQLRSDYTHFISLIRFLCPDLSKSQRFSVEASEQKVRSIIEQDGFLYKFNKEEPFISALEAVDRQLSLIAPLYEVTDEYYLLIPDIDALLANPEIEKWNFNEVDKFKILLLPTVVSELDKAPAQNESAINKIKSNLIKYTKTGNLAEGVKISGENMLSYVGNMPEIETTLPWLDLNNNYDRMIASYFAIVRSNPHSHVVLVTNNPGLQVRAHSSNASLIKLTLLKTDSKPVNVAPADHKPIVEAAGTSPAKNISDTPQEVKPNVKPMQPPEIKPTKVASLDISSSNVRPPLNIQNKTAINRPKAPLPKPDPLKSYKSSPKDVRKPRLK